MKIFFKALKQNYNIKKCTTYKIVNWINYKKIEDDKI